MGEGSIWQADIIATPIHQTGVVHPNGREGSSRRQQAIGKSEPASSLLSPRKNEAVEKFSFSNEFWFYSLL
jgi:hypothetical protein